MEMISNWEAALLAAGISTVYNADDWERISADTRRAAESTEASSSEGSTPRH
jgi:hypothetical protein